MKYMQLRKTQLNHRYLFHSPICGLTKILRETQFYYIYLGDGEERIKKVSEKYILDVFELPEDVSVQGKYYDSINKEIIDNQDYTFCSVCGRVHKSDGVESRCEMCKDEFVVCSKCNRVIPEGQGRTNINGGIYCERCTYGSRICTKCGEITFRPVNRKGYCESCRKYDKNVLNYGFKPEKVYFNGKNKKESTELYMGIEFEVEACADKIEEKVTRAWNMWEDKSWFYKKHDGSLNSGFEIVTHPLTLDYHKKVPWKQLLENLKLYGGTSESTTSTGIHIHFDKSFLDKDELLNFVYLFSFQRANIEKVSRRGTHFARFTSISRIAEGGLTPLHDHYSAINLSNEHTIEIRTFKGTLSYKTLIATMEFLDAFIRWSKTYEFNKKELVDKSWNSFLRFSKDYLYFQEYWKTVKDLDIAIEYDEEDEEGYDEDDFDDEEEYD